MNENHSYKQILGMLHAKQVEHSKIKVQIKTNYLIKSINTHVISSITYSSGIIKWKETESTQIVQLIRTEMANPLMHFKNSCVDRTLPRSAGGLGITDINNIHR